MVKIPHVLHNSQFNYKVSDDRIRIATRGRCSLAIVLITFQNKFTNLQIQIKHDSNRAYLKLCPGVKSKLFMARSITYYSEGSGTPADSEPRAWGQVDSGTGGIPDTPEGRMAEGGESLVSLWGEVGGGGG